MAEDYRLAALLGERVFITRLCTGEDSQTHVEEIDAKFTTDNTNDVSKMMGISGAELHSAPAGTLEEATTTTWAIEACLVGSSRRSSFAGHKVSCLM